MKKAIVFGSTGLTGSCLLKELTKENAYDLIICFVRQDQKPPTDRIHFITTDFSDLSHHKEQFTVADVYCCLGTTIKKVNYNKEAFKRADLYIPLEIAKLAKEENANQLLVISAMGANKSSIFFYNQVKGELEEKLIAFNLPSLSILKPSFLTGKRNEKRNGEKIAQGMMNFLDPVLIGGFKKYRLISGEEVAKAMLQLAKMNLKGNNIYQSHLLKEIGATPKATVH